MKEVLGEIITLLDKQKIIFKHYHDGKSQRAIRRETGIYRKTIRKYIKKHESNRSKILDEGEISSKKELIQNIVEKPIRQQQSPGTVIIFYLSEEVFD